MGIAGGSGSGKTFFLKCFLKHFTHDEVCLVSQDDYYIPVAHTMTAEENKLHNFDLPSAIDHTQFEQDISKLLNHQTIYKKEYTFNNLKAIPKILEIKPAPIIIHFREIAKMTDLKIFIDAYEDIALQRRLKRDFNERGYPPEAVMYKWVNHVLPAFNKFLLPYKGECDKIITNNSHEAEDIICITEEISAELRKKLF